MSGTQVKISKKDSKNIYTITKDLQLKAKDWNIIYQLKLNSKSEALSLKENQKKRCQKIFERHRVTLKA